MGSERTISTFGTQEPTPPPPATMEGLQALADEIAAGVSKVELAWRMLSFVPSDRAAEGKEMVVSDDRWLNLRNSLLDQLERLRALAEEMQERV